MATPEYTLTATLDDITGVAAGSASNPAKLRICLCGFGPLLPAIAGTAMLAKVGPMDFYSTGTPLSIVLWGNDQVVPAGTFYSIEILDGQDNVVQCGAYILTGAGADLSTLTPIVPPLPPTPSYVYLRFIDEVIEMTGTAGAFGYSPSTLVGLFKNGSRLTALGGSPDFSYSGNTITLTVPAISADFFEAVYWTPAETGPGTFYDEVISVIGTSGTFSEPPTTLVGLFKNGQRLTTLGGSPDFSYVGTAITLNVADSGDFYEAVYWA